MFLPKQNASTSPYIFLLGNNVILADLEFSTGYQQGISDFTKLHKTSPVAVQDIFSVLLKVVANVQETQSHAAGYVTGWMKSLCDESSEDDTLIQIKVAPEE